MNAPTGMEYYRQLVTEERDRLVMLGDTASAQIENRYRTGMEVQIEAGFWYSQADALNTELGEPAVDRSKEARKQRLEIRGGKGLQAARRWNAGRTA